jgi:hypothetical protein
VLPGFFSHIVGIGGMKAVDRTENTELQPAQIQFIILNTTHMSTNIMTPPGIAGICSIRCKIGLEIKAFPGNNCIAGETERISVTSKAGIPGQNKRTSLPSCIV